ncbi:GntR family transcriptional regulator [Neorhizobium sp. SOG26]|uniref:GntR family transcriptional regulator n=1 Tax=Neorhizobium sp. SOG26 TaxID=2060726 RepID=UPI00267B9D68
MSEVSATVAEAVLSLIRQDIISGALPPGSKIKLEQARARYSASVSTLREILNRLVADGLVVAEGQRGFEVSPVSKKNLIELGDLRLLLEGHAISLSFEAGDLDWEARVVAAHHKLWAIERQLLEGDGTRTADWVRYDWEFHQALVSACQSQTLIATLSSVFDRFLRYHLLAESFRGKPVVDDHRLLFELAMKRDVAGAQNMLARHIRNGTEHVIKSGRIR